MNNKSFKEFGINSEVVKALKKLGYEKPTEVQEKVIPYAVKGEDIVVKAQTGSGKTAAFGIPLCEKILIEKKNPQVLVLTPTRELAVQVKEEISNIGRLKRIRCAAVYGKQPVHIQERELRQRVHVIVGTPGRVMDHIVRGNINVEEIKHLVIDEADKMLNMGFVDQVEDIINKLPKDRITMLFSATVPEKIKNICNKYMIEPKNIEVSSKNSTLEKINQVCYEIEKDMKFMLLNKLIYTEKMESCIIFCNTRETVELVTEKMKRKRYYCKALHGGMEQNDRLDTMERFKRGEFHFLIATDVAARGIHIDNIGHVVNYEIPYEKESYVHRIGRTGRAGKSGKAITFVTPYENKFLMELQNYLNYEIQKNNMPTEDEFQEAKEIFHEKIMSRPRIKKENKSNINKGITKIRINSGKKKKIRPGDVLGAISNIKGILPDDIGIIDVQDTMTHIDILNNKGQIVIKALKYTKIKGKTVSGKIIKK
ncbi:DEAD/DEAH box helicase [Clostridium sediminicola]|uniref:DEAD/DEAH box helicase n=1 Tax=Clostridium sediminicola TaxID=3114879 RepID=UPI0031F1DB67